MRDQIAALAQSVRDGSKTARQLVETRLERAHDSQEYNALLSLTEQRALERADAIDARVAAGETVGKLAGVPFVVKDNFLAFGAPTTAASKLLENFTTPLQATAVERLEAEGAICIGKANLDAFAHGGSTENSAYGVTKNAHDWNRVAGGSSGGSAVVTALDIVPFALGTDTGGSIRQPAAFNGVYGIKPTYGAVSRYGVVAMANSTDTIGCFATSASDLRLVMEVMAGRDEHDMTTIDNVYDQSARDVKKIGVIKQTLTDDIDPAIRQATETQLDAWREAGYEVDTVDLSMIDYTLAMYYIIVPAEISSNLARYDGVRYGVRDESATTLAELYGQTRDKGFVTENKRRIMIGSYVLSSGFFDAYYQQAQKARTLLIEQFEKLFAEYDVLVSPTTPTTAFAIGQNSDDPVKMYLSDIMTVPASLAGLPALSVPVGTDESGLPIGLQLIGRRGEDTTLLGFVHDTMEVNS